MIQHIKIENYKSIPSLELDLGRVNVFIGENGCGKTNILEAVALGSAAVTLKLEMLSNKGIRETEPRLMKVGFEMGTAQDPIKLAYKTGNNVGIEVEISESKEDSSRLAVSDWALSEKFAQIQEFEKSISGYLATAHFGAVLIKAINEGWGKQLVDKLNNGDADWLEFMNSNLKKTESSQWSEGGLKVVLHATQKIAKYLEIDDFAIFCPENTHLRRFDEEGQIRPLGIRGEGLFSHLANLARKEPDIFQKINENLQLIDWVEGFEIPNDLIFNERRIRIRDRYLDEGIQYIDQRSSNEGFLYLLFYVTLFVSPYTPKFFAIDNIDNALNPRLCAKLIGELVRLAKEHDKQVIVTAHNPGLLDGLNLNDDEQRLFVISRNKLGHTKALRIEQKPSANGHEPVKLSEQFLRGYIGGIPNI
ncbi:MAG: AAA family ATPase [Saprospiraceae bacterium]